MPSPPPLAAALALAVVLAAVAAAAPDLEKLGKCSDRCMRDFKKCDGTSSDVDYINECAFGKLIGCHCDCRKFLEQAQRMGHSAARLASQAVQPRDQVPHLLRCQREREGFAETVATDEAEKAVECFNREFLAMTDCAQPCMATHDVECATQCVAPGFDAICDCGNRRSSTEFAKCHTACTVTVDLCREGCAQDTACQRQCALELIDCDCGCKRYIDGSTGLRRFLVQLKQRQQTPTHPDQVLGVADDGEAAVHCYHSAEQKLFECTELCPEAVQEQCILRCAKAAFEEICACAAIGPDRPTTSAVSPTGSPLAQFEQCHADCREAYAPCKALCDWSATACLDQCVYDVIKCDCGCKRYIDDDSALRGLPATLRRLRALPSDGHVQH